MRFLAWILASMIAVASLAGVARADAIPACRPWQHWRQTSSPPPGQRGHGSGECAFGPSCSIGGRAAPTAAIPLGLAIAALALRARRSPRRAAAPRAV